MWPDFDREELERALDDYAHASTGTGAGRDCRSPAARSAYARRIVVAGSAGVAVPPHVC